MSSSTLNIIMITILFFLASANALANCPNGCSCDDDTLVVQCEENSRLDVLPITLNPSIQRLVIRNNKIKMIDSSIQFYGELYFLDLSYNHLVSVPMRSFDSQKKLQELHLNHNKISSMSNWTFQGLNSLTVLNLRGNFLEELNKGVFSVLPLLEELNLGQNRISRIDPAAFNGLVSLRVLYLDDNQLNAVPTPSFSLLGSLAELHVGLNAFSSLPDDAFAGLNRLAVLDLGGAGLLNITDGAFKGLMGLRNLVLSDNRLKTIPTSQLSELTRLEDLTLGQNDFTVIEANSFKGLVNLRRLDITGASQLERIEKAAFNENLNLDTLILASNKKLDTIEEGSLVGLPNLRHLVLKENAITTLTESLLAWHELKKLELTDNPLHCGCQLLWLQEKLLQKNFSQVQCASPEHLKDRLLRSLESDDLGCASNEVQQQLVICIVVVVIVAALTTLILLLYHYRRRVHEAFKDYKWNKRAISRKEHEYQKTFSDEDYMLELYASPSVFFLPGGAQGSGRRGPRPGGTAPAPGAAATLPVNGFTYINGPDACRHTHTLNNAHHHKNGLLPHHNTLNNGSLRSSLSDKKVNTFNKRNVDNNRYCRKQDNGYLKNYGCEQVRNNGFVAEPEYSVISEGGYAPPDDDFGRPCSRENTFSC
ncbi:uncharacterized protein LOC143912247 [Arctopsyche grandis]|uniref:uncharacterized protein LOC143912247 n=1 Tax=Arctopsyche grandis TaxID=121162 RepID=UPI00406D729A